MSALGDVSGALRGLYIPRALNRSAPSQTAQPDSPSRLPEILRECRRDDVLEAARGDFEHALFDALGVREPPGVRESHSPRLTSEISLLSADMRGLSAGVHWAPEHQYTAGGGRRAAGDE